jgi:four helix bundle protein
MMMRNFRTYNLSLEFYRKSMLLRLERHLLEQFKRAASSIALNLSEGAGRQTQRDQRRFFTIALGSLRECQAILDLAGLGTSEAAVLADSLAAHIYKLIEKCRGR